MGIRRFTSSLLLIAASVIVSLAAVELLLRAFVDVGVRNLTAEDVPRHLLLMPQSERVYGLKPLDPTLHTNSFGFRGPEYVRNKRPNTFRIIMLGDSVTFGNQEPWDSTFSYLLEGKLNAASPNRRYEIINLAVSGYNTAQELATLREVGLALHPDLVLLNVCINDSDPPKVATKAGLRDITRVSSLSDLNLRTFVASSYVLTFMKHVSHQVTKASPRLRDMLNSERFFINPRVKEQAWAEMKNKMRELHETTTHNNIPLAVVIYPYQSQLRGNSEMHLPQQDLEKFWSARHVPVLDPIEAFQSAREPMFNDGLLHLSRAGHRLMSDEIYSFLVGAQLLSAHGRAVN